MRMRQYILERDILNSNQTPIFEKGFVFIDIPYKLYADMFKYQNDSDSTVLYENTIIATLSSNQSISLIKDLNPEILSLDKEDFFENLNLSQDIKKLMRFTIDSEIDNANEALEFYAW